MVLSSLGTLAYLLSAALPVGKKAKKKGKLRRAPLFRVSDSLAAPEIVISPAANEIYKTMMKYIRSLIDATKQFHRWQQGSCLLTPPQKIAEEEEPIVFSFYSDVIVNVNIMGM